MAVALSEQMSESRSASSDSGVRRSTTASDQGALRTRPTSGSMKNRAPQSARRASSAGGRSPALPTCCSDLREAVAGEYGLPRAAEQEIDERVSPRWVGATLHSRDRVHGDNILIIRDVDAVDLRTGGLDIGDIDDPGIGLAQGHLADHGVDVLLLAFRSHFDPSLGEGLVRVIPAGHGGGGEDHDG